MRILIVKTSSMGDVIHALPVIADIKHHFPIARIDWLVETPFHQVVKLHPAIETVIPISWRKWRKNLKESTVRNAIKDTISTLRAANYDIILDLQGLIKSAVWVKLANGKKSHGFDWASAREPLASLAYSDKHPINPSLLAIERSRLVCGAALGYTINPQKVFGIQAPTTTVNDWAVSEPYIAFVHGSSDDARLWPQKDWLQLAQLAQSKGFAIALIWGSDAEKLRSEQLQNAMQTLGVIAYTPPFLTIAQTAQVLSHASAVIGLDTGFTHLAGALGVPSISIHRTHDPARTGVQGDARCFSLGGIGQTPSYADVANAFTNLFTHEHH